MYAVWLVSVNNLGITMVDHVMSTLTGAQLFVIILITYFCCGKRVDGILYIQNAMSLKYL